MSRSTGAGQNGPQPRPEAESTAPSVQTASAPVSQAEAPASRGQLAIWALVAGVTLPGLALAVIGGVTWDGSHLWALVLLAAMAMAAERTDFSLYGDSRVSLAFVPIFAAVLLGGLPGLTLVVPLTVLASSFGAHRQVQKSLFNFGALMLAGAGSALVFHYFGSAGEPGAWPQVLGPSLLAAALNFAINSGLVAVVVAVATGHDPRSVWREKFPWLWPHYLMLGIMGLALASAYTAMGLWGLAVFLVPSLMMRLSLKQYLDKTTQSVLGLREAHDELSKAHRQVVSTLEQLEKAYDGTIKTLVAALDVRDSETRGHSERVAEMATALAEELAIEPQSTEWYHVRWGALLHDVGKIGVPDDVLRKSGPLTEEEWEKMRAHPGTGHKMLLEVDFLRPAAAIVHAHHERFDGKGYPRRLGGEDIPLGARIFAVADAFDAMTSDRPYRKAKPQEEALAEILRHSGSQFDPGVVRAFLTVYQEQFLGRRRPAPPESGMSDSLRRAILEAAGLVEKQNP